MIAVIFLFEAVDKILLLDVVPESVGLLIFGVVLIASAVTARRLLNPGENDNFERASANAERESVG